MSPLMRGSYDAKTVPRVGVGASPIPLRASQHHADGATGPPTNLMLTGPCFSITYFEQEPTLHVKDRVSDEQIYKIS